MRLFRRNPSGRTPDESGMPTPPAERVRAVRDRDDEETIAELLTLFRETPPPDDPDAGAQDTGAAEPEASDLPGGPGLADGLDDLPTGEAGRVPEAADIPDRPHPPAPEAAEPAQQPPADAPIDVTGIVRAASAAAAPTPGTAPGAAAEDGAAPVAGRASRRAGRVKTRFLGFEHSHSTSDPFSAAFAATPHVADAEPRFPVGWMVVVKGPGRGASFTLVSGVSQIGRGEDQAVRLDFGDTSISRQGHAVVAYDPEQRKHFIGHGGKVNIVRLNDMPVLSTEQLKHGDRIRVGETTLAFIALCGEGFDWQEADTSDADVTTD